MSSDLKEPVNFRLGRRHKQALERLAAERHKALSELLRDVVEAYVSQEERRAWEAEAHRQSLVLADEAKDPTSPEAKSLALLDANLEAFAEEWVWEDET